jgi:hypothetical protein
MMMNTALSISAMPRFNCGGRRCVASERLVLLRLGRD